MLFLKIKNNKILINNKANLQKKVKINLIK